MFCLWLQIPSFQLSEPPWVPEKQGEGWSQCQVILLLGQAVGVSLTWTAFPFYFSWTLTGIGDREVTVGTVEKAVDSSTQATLAEWMRWSWPSWNCWPGFPVVFYCRLSHRHTQDCSGSACHPLPGLSGLSIILWSPILYLQRCFFKKN